jgi:hypothetical protein
MNTYGKFDRLWNRADCQVLVNKKELKQFVQDNTNNLGNTFIIVKGECRLIKWKSIGLGLYKVWTEEWKS